MSGWRLVADIGGTNVRFARAGGDGRLVDVVSYATADSRTFGQALDTYLAATGGVDGCVGGALGAAGPIDGQSVRLTNLAAWLIDGAEVSARLAGAPVALVNDLEAVAAALPYLADSDLRQIGRTAIERPARRTMLALNVGTGLGAAIATRRADRWWTLPSEAGHMTLGLVTSEEQNLLQAGATNESLLSGAGVARLYARLSGNETPIGTADVLARAAHDSQAGTVVRLVTSTLGRIAGDLVLATGAWGGVYLCGSVAVGWSAVADQNQFRHAFESKGPMQERMAHVPTAIIRRDNAALFGLAMIPLPV